MVCGCNSGVEQLAKMKDNELNVRGKVNAELFFILTEYRHIFMASEWARKQNKHRNDFHCSKQFTTFRSDKYSSRCATRNGNLKCYLKSIFDRIARGSNFGSLPFIFHALQRTKINKCDSFCVFSNKISFNVDVE